MSHPELEHSQASAGNALTPGGGLIKNGAGFLDVAGQGAGEEPRSPSGPGPKAFLQALRRRWLLALALGLVIPPLAVVVAWRMFPSRYTARTLLYVQAHQPVILAPGRDNVHFQTYQRTQIALLKCRLVVNSALRQPEVAKLGIVQEHANPADWLETTIKGDYSLAPEILRITLGGDRPAELVILLNAVRDAYLREIVENERSERMGRLEKLQMVLANFEKDIGDKSANLRKLALEAGSNNTELLVAKHKFTLERLAMAQKDLLQLQSELRKAVIELGAQQAREKVLDEAALPENAIQQLLRQDPVVMLHLNDLAKAEQAIEETMRLSAGRDDEPALVKLRARLEGAQQALAARQDLLRPGIIKELRNKAEEQYRAGVAQGQARVGLLTDLASAVARDADELARETAVINKGFLDIGSLQDELSQTKDIAKKIGIEMQTLKIELDAPHRVRLLEEATVNADAAKKRLMAMGGAGLGTFLLAVFGIAWLELRARRISTIDEVQRGTRLRLVGTLPALPARGRLVGPLVGSPERARAGVQLLHESRGDAFIVRSQAPSRPEPAPLDIRLLLESVDATRTVLLHAAQLERVSAVMVTSAFSGEGKTSLATHLAVSLARGGFNTLLVDGDLRRPALSMLFGLPPGPGLGELLQGRASLNDAARATIMPGLRVLPAGHCEHHHLQALVRRRGQKVFQALKGRYDMVIVDSAPVLPVADSLLLAQHVDGVLFSILRDVSRMPSLLAAYDRVSMLGIRILGAVMAGVTTDDYYSPQMYAGYQCSAV
jgi:capsular exopolysaccharide synthesis family protein